MLTCTFCVHILPSFSKVLYQSKEKFWFADKEDKPKDWSNNVHVLEFESPMTDFLSWGLRNFNKAIKTP